MDKTPVDPKIAYWRAFLPLVHVLRSPFLMIEADGQPIPLCDIEKQTSLKWFVVTENNTRMLSCKETRSNADRKDRYEALRRLWDSKLNESELPTTIFSRVLSTTIFSSDSLDGVIVLRDKSEADQYKQWLKDFSLTKLWDNLTDENVVVINQEFKPDAFTPVPTLTTEAVSTDKERKTWINNACEEFKTYIDNVIKSIPEEYAAIKYWNDWSKKELAAYFAWLMCHDPDAQAWIYLKSPQETLFGRKPDLPPQGVVVCLGALPAEDDVAHRFLDTLGWGIANGFEMLSILEASQSSHDMYLYGTHSEIQAKTILLNQIRLQQADLAMEIPRGDQREKAVRYRQTFAPLSCTFPFLSEIKDFRWASFFEWDPVYDILDRTGWAVGCGWPNIIEKLMEYDEYWANITIAVSRFNHAADAMEFLHKKNLIELLGNILFAQSSRKCPVIISCRRESSVSSVEDVNHIPCGYEPLKEKYGYMFLTLDMIMQELLPIVQAEARTIDDQGVAYDYVAGLDQCYRTFTDKIGGNESKKLGEAILKHFETTLHPTLKDKDIFAKKIIKHIIWVFLHETNPNAAFQCLVYFPSRIKPDMPSGGCLIAFNTMPSPIILFLVDNYVSDYFLARSLLNSEFETDYPCTLTNKGFERAVLTSVQRIIREEGKEANLTLAFLDMDGLKKINDTTKSHILGTVAIRAFAESVASHITQKFRLTFGNNSKIFFGRWGGDEFLIGVLSSGPHGQTVQEKKKNALETEENLKKFCKDITGTASWNKYIKKSIDHFIGQQRISDTEGVAQTSLMHALNNDSLHFTAGIGSCNFSSPNDPFFQKYEKLRNDVDKVCYIAKHFRRGSILKLTDEIEKDDKGIPICLNNKKFTDTLKKLYSKSPRNGYVVLIKLEGSQGWQQYRLLECICDSFESLYCGMAEVFGTLEPSPEIIAAIDNIDDDSNPSNKSYPVIMVAIDNIDDEAKPSICQMYTFRSQWAQTLEMEKVMEGDANHDTAQKVSILAIRDSAFEKFADHKHDLIKDDLIIHENEKPYVFWLQDIPKETENAIHH